MRTFLSILLLCFLRTASVAQEEVCVCASYHSQQWKTDYDELLPPALLKSKGIKQVMVYTTATNRQDEKKEGTIYVRKSLSKEYPEMKFSLNSNGQVTRRLWYNQMGKPHSIYQMDRNEKGQVIRITFNYSDSLENIFKGLPGTEITDYSYDKKGRLIYEKKRDYNGKIQPDDKSSYTKYEYDSLGRVTVQTRQFYYENTAPTSVMRTEIRYDNRNFTSASRTYTDKKLFLSSNTTYTNSWKPLTDSDYNHLAAAPSIATTCVYDSLQRLIRFTSKAGKGAGDECPEGNDYVEQFFYTADGLIEKILHSYGKYTCEMRFEYQ